MAADQYQTKIASLLHFDGANGATSTTDAGYVGIAPGFVGTAALSTTQKQFGTASLKTGGANGNYLRLPAGRGYDVGSGDFTLESFVWPVSQGATYGAIIGRWDDAGAQDFLLWRGASGELNFSVNGTLVVAGAADDLPTGVFAHVAVTRQGTTFKTWVGGVQKGSGTMSGAINCTPGLMLVFGQANFSGGTTFLEAYYDEFCLTIGVCRYTAGFTPMAVAYENPASPIRAALLLHGDGANNSTIIADSSAYQRPLVLNAGVKLTASNPKFGSASILFSGSSNGTSNQDTILLPVDSTLGLGTADFTIEMFVRINTMPTSGNLAYLLDYRPLGTQGLYPTLYVDNTGKVNYYANSSLRITSVAALVVGTYAHVALVRASGVTTLYMDGNPTGSTYADANNYTVGTNGFVSIGSIGTVLGQYVLNGQLEEFRITTGLARYTAAFTPPTAAFPDETVTRVSQCLSTKFYYQSKTRMDMGHSVPPARIAATHDRSWGGRGRVAGQTTVNNTPTPQPVRLHEAAGAGLARRVWSDANGNYSFDFVDETLRYMVIGTDYTKTYNAVVQDNITPVLMPLYANYPTEYQGRMRRKITQPQTVGLGAGHTILLRVGESAASMQAVSNGISMAANAPFPPGAKADISLPLKTFPTTKGAYTSDINFTDLAGNPIPYWLEQVWGTAPNRIAYYWVNLPGNLDSADQSFYVWYNGATPSTSTPGATFPVLFDDFTFTSNNMDATKWVGYPSLATAANNSVSGGENYFYGLNQTALREIRTLASFGPGYEFIGNYYAPGVGQGFPTISTAGQWAGMGFVTGTLGTGTSRLASIYNAQAATDTRFAINGEADTAGQLVYIRQADSIQHRMVLQRGTDGVVNYYDMEHFIASRSGVASDSAQFCLARWYNAGPGVNYFFARKYIQNTPALIIFPEEAAP